MDNIKNFGPNLRSRIDIKGYKTYKKAADAFGISLSYLNQLMRNEREPSLELLGVISSELGCSSSQLLGDESVSIASPDRATLILDIQSRLTALNEKELGFVSGFIDDLEARSSRGTNKNAVGEK